MTRQIRCDIEVEILTGGAGRGIACSDAARAADLPRISALAPDCAKAEWLGRRGVGLVASRQPTASSVAAMAIETGANHGVRWKGYIVASRLE